MSDFMEHKLIEEFKDRVCFSREELLGFYLSFEPDLKEGTFSWRIFDLKNKNIIRPVRRGLYVISHKPVYKPVLSPNFIELAKQITTTFEDVNYCIWETEWLNEFSQHQSGKQIVLIEIEKDFLDSLYFEIKDSSEYELYLNPDEKTIRYYIAESNYPVIIKKMVTRSPVASRIEKGGQFYTPLLEKILVDLFADEQLFYFLQGSELSHIYKNAISNYAIDFTKLFSYAKRRDREEDIRQFLINHMPQLVKDII